ncbi:MAG TPA: HAMP domain-containing histidine kinase [Bacteroidetes bacterium]|nr:HAMP domain-containing histidine kinase [Bacteroidota bacterium]
MKRNLLAITVLLALAGLTFVQFRLLVIGARLEKQRFDQRAMVAQRSIKQSLNQPNGLSDRLVAYLKGDTLSREKTSALADSLQLFLENKFAEEGITARFLFAITPRHRQDVELASNGFKEAGFQFGEYKVPLGDYFSRQLFREKELHIDMENLFGYLLGELDYLLVPSVLCLLALLVCLGLLLHILRKEEKLNEVKNDFINNLTHELKTPIFSISLASKLANEQLGKGNADKAAEFLRIIEKENEKLKGHTEKVLELASLENSKQQLKQERVDLHQLIGQVLNDHLPKVKNKNGLLRSSLRAPRFEIKTDGTHFKNLLQNLLDNALKYSNGAPEIEVATDSNAAYFILSVKDNGIGIPPADQPFVFDKFFRTTTGDRHDVKGFGLGLSYVKQVVEAQKGKVEVESKLGEGSVFRVYLPV